ncbi:alpha/beta fold hydrolase [Pseudoteredinibacter isoporae]|uniref:alpha/beta fold hydrolase n=1 Tax=Pseudoteredinibacter isoporae TaxID=570281 RepID=UPI00310BE2C1
MSERLNYRIDGDDTQAPRETVVLIHGLFGSLENLGAIARALEPDYRLVSVDLPNHGRSPWRDKHSMSLKAMATQLLDLLDHLGIQQCALLGHSLGGKVAMELAMNWPERVSRLIVADIAPVQYPRRHDGIFAALRALPLDQLKGRRDAEHFLQDKIDEAGVRQFLLKSLYKDESGHYQWRMNLEGLYDAYDEFVAAPSALSYSGPCLFIKGELSDYVLEAHTEAVVSRFPKVQLKVMQGCTHWLHVQKPETFARLCIKFLAS